MSAGTVIGLLRFTMRDQEAFAEWTGDRNPMHVDVEAARRRFPGEPIAHGVHVVLRALDVLARTSDGSRSRPAGVDATFVRPVLLGEDVDVVVHADDVVRIELGGEPLAVVRLRDDPRHAPRGAGRSAARTGPDPEIAVTHGTVAPIAGGDGTGTLDAVRGWLGSDAVAELAAVSTVVGMHCPGERAVLAEISVDLDGSAAPASTGVAFELVRTVTTFNRVELALTGSALHGRAAAFVTPAAPEPQTSTLRSLVAPDRFAEDAPLVVGGSRGLGAVAARLLALGGAQVLVGYHRGEQEAAELIARIRGDGGRAEAVRVDVSDPGALVRELDVRGWEGQHVHFMATPRILRRHLGVLRPALLDELVSVYVEGFAGLVDALLARRPGRALRIGYPSSVAVDDPPADMLEYAVAKSAGERRALRLMCEHPELDVHVLRLPRIETEQTVSFARAPSVAAEAALLPLLEQVHARVEPARTQGAVRP
jgi:NAD(P)-dependent dehydrogenase (short-subunit alcohol dehydrogenase family)